MVDYTYNDIIISLAQKLAEAEIPNAHWEARELAGAALGFNCRGRFDGGKRADSVQVSMCAALLARRLSHEPLQYIIGEWDFCGETFKVGEGVLIPRADTETLIERTMEIYKGCDGSGMTITDLCSGSGCIGITLKRLLKNAEVFCVEKYVAAFSYLEENIASHGGECKAVKGDVLDEDTVNALPQADLIICNPPYINAQDMQRLQREVRHEPQEALYGGEDGYDFYRGIVRLWKRRLKENGVMMFEIGAGQESEVMEIMIQSGLRDVRVRKDMAGINRCVFGKNKTIETTNLYEQLK